MRRESDRKNDIEESREGDEERERERDKENMIAITSEGKM